MHLRVGGQQTTRSADAKKFLEERAIELLKDQRRMSFVPIFLHPDSREEDGPAYVVGQILGGFREVTTQREQIEGEWVGRRTKVVDVLYVDNVTHGERYRLQTTERCDKAYFDCGPKAAVPCYKRHVRTVRLSALRPPCSPDALRDVRRSSARLRARRGTAATTTPSSAAVDYAMLPSTKQALHTALMEDARDLGAAHVI